MKTISISGYVVPAPDAASIPVASGSDYPVRQVYCAGCNYAAHSIEMSDDQDRDPLFFFQKSPSNLDVSGKCPYPEKTNDVQYKIEIVVALKTGGSNSPVETALGHVYGYAPCLDMHVAICNRPP